MSLYYLSTITRSVGWKRTKRKHETNVKPKLCLPSIRKRIYETSSNWIWTMQVILTICPKRRNNNLKRPQILLFYAKTKILNVNFCRTSILDRRIVYFNTMNPMNPMERYISTLLHHVFSSFFLGLPRICSRDCWYTLWPCPLAPARELLCQFFLLFPVALKHPPDPNIYARTRFYLHEIQLLLPLQFLGRSNIWKYPVHFASMSKRKDKLVYYPSRGYRASDGCYFCWGRITGNQVIGVYI